MKKNSQNRTQFKDDDYRFSSVEYYNTIANNL